MRAPLMMRQRPPPLIRMPPQPIVPPRMLLPMSWTLTPAASAPPLSYVDRTPLSLPRPPLEMPPPGAFKPSLASMAPRTVSSPLMTQRMFASRWSGCLCIKRAIRPYSECPCRSVKVADAQAKATHCSEVGHVEGAAAALA
jgi:hypothetical protein